MATGGQQIVMVIKQELTCGQRTQLQNWRQSREKNAIFPANRAQTLAGTTKELVCFKSVAAGPH